jgi:histidinol phosphatase-like enzyme (inositol monophosphatase family)
MTAHDETPSCPEAFIDLAGRLAGRAREISGRHFRGGFTVEQKPDRTPVTVADREAEAAMRAMIAEAFPDHGILGEEHGHERAGAPYLWVLDPIDGTKRFATGHPQFGTLIALLHEGRPILGVIDMPALGECWIGALGRPTEVTDARGRRAARTRACPSLDAASLYVNAPDTFLGDDLAALERLRAVVGMTLYDGDCYAYGLVASGYADLVLETDMAPYDFLALAPVVAGAGGCITDWRGKALELGSDGRVLAAGDAALHRAALGLLAET